jgi:uncharacterized protein DUF6134
MRYFLSAILLSAVFVPAAHAQESVKVLTYKVHHALFGDIGKFSDEISYDGETTRVETKGDVRVDIFGVTVHRLHAEWNEIWQNGALTDYRAATTRNGSLETVSGKHEGDRFVGHAGEKSLEAPVGVQPVHPWSLQFIHAGTLMSPQSGRLFPANISDEGEESIAVGRKKVHVHHYIVRSDITNHLYFDDEGTLVSAQYRDITGLVSLTLETSDHEIANAR